jgi:hypothetical protein
MHALGAERVLGSSSGLALLEGEGLRARRSDHARLAQVATTGSPPARKLGMNQLHSQRLASRALPLRTEISIIL